MFTDLGISLNQIKFISMIDNLENPPNSWDAFYGKENFDWLGHCKNVEVNEFVNIPFDLLISYYKPNSYELNIVTAMSKANFKIGLSSQDKRLHDFIIEIDPENIDTLTELYEIDFERFGYSKNLFISSISSFFSFL